MKKLIILLNILLIACFQISAQSVTFKGSAPSSVAANQHFNISYTITIIDGGGQAKDIRVPDVTGLEQLYGPQMRQSQSSSWVNGQSSSQIAYSYIYTYMAKEPGTYTIPETTIKFGNSTYKSNTLTIVVVPEGQAVNNNQSRSNQGSVKPNSSSASIGSDEVFMKMHISKRSVYESEGFLVSFKLYTKYLNMGFDNFQFPNFDGFIAQEIEMPRELQVDSEVYNNSQYHTAIVKQVILFPTKSGNLSIGAGKYDVQISKIVENSRPRSFFDMFPTTQTVRKTLTTPAVEINVKPLPAGKPSNFSGAVGDFSLSSSINTEELKTDEVVSVKLNIKGSGNLKFLKNPVVKFPNDFDELDPKTTESTKASRAGVNGSVSVEYHAIPRYSGTFTIPGVSFSYFDLKTESYKTLSSPDYSIKVLQGEGSTAAPATIAGTNKEDIKYLGQDIRYIRTNNIAFEKANYFYGTMMYWMWYIIPAIVFIVFFIIYRKQVSENANMALARTKKANKVASKRLKLAGKYLKENKTEAFYEEISKAVWGYLGDKLNMPAAALTKDNIETEMTDKGFSAEIIASFLNILNTAEFARFAPAGGHEAMDELYSSTVEAINKMEK